MAAYLDCLACACLIRVSEPSCPFCGATQRVVSAPSRLGLGLVLGLGLGLSMFGCVGEEGEDTIGGSQEADAVTYAGPDDPTHSTPGGTDTIADSQEADAVTYAGPDETTTAGDYTTTGYDTTTSGGTTTTTTATDTDTQEADAVTYAGPDETDSTSGG
jgi:hypothetical protein